MPRIFCVHCEIPVVVDPQGRCPEGHVPDRTGEPGPGELGRAHDAPATSDQGSGDVDRIDLQDALRAVAGSSVGAEGIPAPERADGPTDIAGDERSRGQTQPPADDEPRPWVWDATTSVGEADDGEAVDGEAVDGEADGDADEVPEDDDLLGTPSDGDPEVDGSSEPPAAGPTPSAFGDDLDLFDDLGEPAAPAGTEVVTPPLAPNGGDDDDLAFLFDAEARGGEEPATDGVPASDGDPAAETRPIPIVSTTDPSRVPTPGPAIDPTNFTSRGGRVDESPGGGGWRARLGRRRVS